MAANLRIIHTQRERHLAERGGKGSMAYHGALEMDSKVRSEAGRPVVDATQALIVETVKRLSRSCPPNLLEEAAREELLALKPRLEEAIEALEDIKRRRSLTEEELVQHYAFKMLLACRGVDEAGPAHRVLPLRV